jgi:hypothetical protein|nr:YfiR family protein [Candidatus Krumholzibacteria bacterium]
MKRRDAISLHAQRTQQIRLGFLILVALLMPGYSRAQGLTEKEQLPTFMKVLAYDRTFNNVPVSSLRLGILFRPDLPASVAGEREMRDALNNFNENGPRGMVWNHESVFWTSPEELARKLTGSEIDILYVTPGQESLIPLISRWTRSLDILTLAPGHREVDLGLSVGLAFHDEHPRIAVNLKALQEEGHELDSRILRLCKVVRE